MVRSRLLRLAVAVAACQLLSTTSAQSAAASTSALASLSSQNGLISATLAPTPISLGSSATRSGSSATSSASSEPQVHLIKVGSGGFRFTPPELTNVSAGDTVTFEFYPLDHSVVQAEFGSACVPYSYADKNHDGKGFWTPTQWVNNTSQITHFNITINDTAPIFFYCAAPNSCIGELMVGAINANSTQTLASQIQAAKNADFQLAVGDPVPNEATSTILNGPTSAPAPSSSGGTHLSGGAIAGIVVGAVAFLVICAALFFYVGRSKSLKEVIKRQDATTNGNRTSTPGPDMGYISHDNQVPRYGSPAPAYGQHNVGEQYPSGWQGSPQMHQGHLSMQSQMSGMSQEQLDYYKHTQAQVPPAELHSPQPGQEEFRAELADNNAQKPPRSP